MNVPYYVTYIEPGVADPKQIRIMASSAKEACDAAKKEAPAGKDFSARFARVGLYGRGKAGEKHWLFAQEIVGGDWELIADSGDYDGTSHAPEEHINLLKYIEEKSGHLYPWVIEWKQFDFPGHAPDTIPFVKGKKK